MSLLGAIAVGGRVLGGLRKRRASKQMKAMGREQALMAQENAMLERRELSEQVRRTEAQNQLVGSTALTRAAASGVTMKGSAQDFLSYIEAEQTRQVDWMQEAGASKIRLNLQANLLQAKSTNLNAKSMQSGFLTDIAGAFGMAGKLGMFGAPKTGGKT